MLHGYSDNPPSWATQQVHNITPYPARLQLDNVKLQGLSLSKNSLHYNIIFFFFSNYLILLNFLRYVFAL